MKLIGLSIAILLLSCFATVSFGQTKIKNNVKYQSVKLQKDDATFLALKDTAQKHIAIFISAVQQHGKDTNNYRLVVKSDFVENGHHEHMWSRVMMYSKGIFAGVFIDLPFTLKNIKTGDRVTIKQIDVEDWSIENRVTGKTTGEFSAKYLDSQH